MDLRTEPGDANYKNIVAQMTAAGDGPERPPVPEMVDAKTVKERSRKMATNIFSSWHLLRDILDRHQATIQKRWSRKTRKQRMEILLTAWPNMAPTHRPDIAAYACEDPQQRDADTKHRDAYLCPFINLEDLAKPNILPLFLNARAWTTPSEFAMADKNVFCFGCFLRKIIPYVHSGYTMTFPANSPPENYGELVCWKDNPDARSWLHTGKGMLPGQGLLVLEKQERVLHFLVSCCKHIMHDISFEELTSSVYPVQRRPDVPTETGNGFGSLAVMAAEAPYRPPANMDLARLESLFSAKLSAAEDHIWDMREDPGYFADTVLTIQDHCQPFFATESGETLLERSLGTIPVHAHQDLEIWSEMLSQVREVRRLQSKYASVISIEKDLPEEFLGALLRFRYYLGHGAFSATQILTRDAFCSPPICRYMRTSLNKDPRNPHFVHSEKADVTLEGAEGILIWLLCRLSAEADDLPYFAIMVEELNYLIENEPATKDMLTTHVTDLLGGVAALAAGFRQVDLYQPWSQSFADLMRARKMDLDDEFKQSTSRRSYYCKRPAKLPDHLRRKIIRLGTPEGGRFYYPVDKGRTKENTEIMRKAERNLDDFWNVQDQILRKEAGREFKDLALYKLLSQPRFLQRTPEWIDPAQRKINVKSTRHVEHIRQALSAPHLDLNGKKDGTTGRQVLKENHPSPKPKTRGTPGSVLTIGPPQAEPLTAPDQHPCFTVDSRSSKVFRNLFYSPSISTAPGEIAWKDFLHAMHSIGFATEKLSGSTWQFTPKKLDVKRSIQFHEPHPESKLAFWVARRYGRRLERTYGWTGSTFVEKEKGVGK